MADAILESIHEKLTEARRVRIDSGKMVTIENTVSNMERRLNSIAEALQKANTDLDLKADNATIEALRNEIEE